MTKTIVMLSGKKNKHLMIIQDRLLNITKNPEIFTGPTLLLACASYTHTSPDIHIMTTPLDCGNRSMLLLTKHKNITPTKRRRIDNKTP